MTSNQSHKRDKTFFAITSQGKKGWYWVVWTSLSWLQSDEASQPLASGYEKSKAEAVDEALNVAGMDGEWLAAKYAKQYHRQLSHQKRKKGNHAPASLTKIEFLYHDLQDGRDKKWYSVPHRLIKKTKKYVYVDQEAYHSTKVMPNWVDHHTKTFRLNRKMLEQEGYAFVPPTTDIDDPLFFTTPYQERRTHYRSNPPACLVRLGLSFPSSATEVKSAYRRLAKEVHPDQGGTQEEFLALQAAYQEALRLCR